MYKLIKDQYVEGIRAGKMSETAGGVTKPKWVWK